MNSEIGWVFIYIGGFGISDFVVKKYCSGPYLYILYYIIIGVIGISLIKIYVSSRIIFKVSIFFDF